jgi:hypothetical protein
MAAVRRVAPQVLCACPRCHRRRAPGDCHADPAAAAVAAAAFGRSVLHFRADQVGAPPQPPRLRRSLGRLLAQGRQQSGDLPHLPELDVVATPDPGEVDAGVGGQRLRYATGAEVMSPPPRRQPHVLAQ